MKFHVASIFVISSTVLDGQKSQALKLSKILPQNCADDNEQAVNNLAQTQTEFIDLIADCVKLGIRHLFPLEPIQRQKVNGTKINAVEADNENERHGAKFSGN